MCRHFHVSSNRLPGAVWFSTTSCDEAISQPTNCLVAGIVGNNAEPLSPLLRPSHLSSIGQNTSWQQVLVLAAEALCTTLSLCSLLRIEKNAVVATALLPSSAVATPTITPELVVMLTTVATMALPFSTPVTIVALLTAALWAALREGLVETLDDSIGVDAEALGALCPLRFI